jgi:hypothetical protein
MKKRKPEDPQPVSRRRLMEFLTAAALATPAAVVASEQAKPTGAPKPGASSTPSAPAGVEKIAYLTCEGMSALMDALKTNEGKAAAQASGNPKGVDALAKQLEDFLQGGNAEYGGMLIRIIKTNREPPARAKSK